MPISLVEDARLGELAEARDQLARLAELLGCDPAWGAVNVRVVQLLHARRDLAAKLAVDNDPACIAKKVDKMKAEIDEADEAKKDLAGMFFQLGLDSQLKDSVSWEETRDSIKEHHKTLSSNLEELQELQKDKEDAKEWAELQRDPSFTYSPSAVRAMAELFEGFMLSSRDLGLVLGATDPELALQRVVARMTAQR